MTLAEYKTTLESKMWFVSEPKDLTIADNGTRRLYSEYTNDDEVKLFGVHYIRKLKNGAGQGIVQQFWVKDYGLVSEEVQPINQELDNETLEIDSHPFRDLVRAYLDANHISATIPKITIDVADENEEFAIVTAYMVNAGQVTPKKYFLYHDGATPVFMEYIG